MSPREGAVEAVRRPEKRVLLRGGRTLWEPHVPQKQASLGTGSEPLTPAPHLYQELRLPDGRGHSSFLRGDAGW